MSSAVPVPPAAPPVADVPAAAGLGAVPGLPCRVFDAEERLDLYVVMRVVYARNGAKSLALFVPGMFPGVVIGSGVLPTGVAPSLALAQEVDFFIRVLR